MRIRKLLVPLIATLAMAGCGGSVKHIVTRLDSTSKAPDPLDTRGVVYSLPKTLLTVQVPVVLTISAPGQYKKDVAGYTTSPLPVNVQADKDALEAAFYELGIKDPTLASSVEAKKLKIGSPTIAASAVQDPDHVYLVHIDSGRSLDKLLSLTFDENGFLTAGASDITDRRVELFSKSIETLAGLATKSVGIGQAGLISYAPQSTETNPYSKGLTVISALDGVQSQRLNLLGGGTLVNVPADTVKLMLEALAKEEQKLRAYFWRKKVVSWTAHVEYDPVSASALSASVHLFDVVQSGPDKMVTIENGSAQLLTPIPGDFSRPATCSGCTAVAVKVTHTAQSAMANTIAKQSWTKSANKDLGFRYRVPQPVDIAIERSGHTLARDLIPIAQLGEVIALPSDPGGSKSKYDLALYGSSGGLKKIDVSSTAATSSLIEGLGSAGSAILDIEAKQAEIAAAGAVAASEKTKLTAEVEMLRLLKEKQELETALLEAEE